MKLVWTHRSPAYSKSEPLYRMDARQSARHCSIASNQESHEAPSPPGGGESCSLPDGQPSPVADLNMVSGGRQPAEPDCRATSVAMRARFVREAAATDAPADAGGSVVWASDGARRTCDISDSSGGWPEESGGEAGGGGVPERRAGELRGAPRSVKEIAGAGSASCDSSTVSPTASAVNATPTQKARASLRRRSGSPTGNISVPSSSSSPSGAGVSSRSSSSSTPITRGSHQTFRKQGCTVRYRRLTWSRGVHMSDLDIHGQTSRICGEFYERTKPSDQALERLTPLFR